MRVHHIGYLTKKMEETEPLFRQLGFSPQGEMCYDNDRIAYILFLCKDGYVVELIQPTGEQSPLYSLLKRYKNTPYHICYEVQELAKEVQNLILEGYRVIREREKAIALHNREVVFLQHPSIGIIELLNAEQSKGGC